MVVSIEFIFLFVFIFLSNSDLDNKVATIYDYQSINIQIDTIKDVYEIETFKASKKSYIIIFYMYVSSYYLPITICVYGAIIYIQTKHNGFSLVNKSYRVLLIYNSVNNTVIPTYLI